MARTNYQEESNQSQYVTDPTPEDRCAGRAVVYEYPNFVAAVYDIGNRKPGELQRVSWTPSPFIPGDPGFWMTEIGPDYDWVRPPWFQMVPPSFYGSNLTDPLTSLWYLAAGSADDVVFNSDGSVTLNWSGNSTNPYFTGDRAFLSFTSIRMALPLRYMAEVGAVYSHSSDGGTGNATKGVGIAKAVGNGFAIDNMLYSELQLGGGNYDLGTGYHWGGGTANTVTANTSDLAASTTRGAHFRLRTLPENPTGNLATLLGNVEVAGSPPSYIGGVRAGAPIMADFDDTSNANSFEPHFYVAGASGDNPNTSVRIQAIGFQNKFHWANYV